MNNEQIAEVYNDEEILKHPLFEKLRTENFAVAYVKTTEAEETFMDDASDNIPDEDKDEKNVIAETKATTM
jgi:hypothetical protein